MSHVAASDPLQLEARALGDPTRYAIFRYLVDADAAVDVAELTDAFGFNHNAIRQHLAKLLDAALVIEETGAPAGRGRPRHLYRVAPSAESRWGATGPYERLTLLLSEMVRTGDDPRDVGRRAGRRQPLNGAVDADPVASVVDAMARDGFDPVLRRRRDGVEIVLRTCPYATTATADPDIVCAMHLGVAEGLAEQTGDEIAIEELVRHDPRRGELPAALTRAGRRRLTHSPSSSA